MKVIAFTLALIAGSMSVASTANAGWTGSRNGPYMNWNNPSTGQSFTCSRNGAYINCG